MSLSVQGMHKSVDRVSHLGWLIEIIEVTGVGDPFDLDVGAFYRNVCKDGRRLSRVAVGLQLQHPEGEIVLADLANRRVQVPVAVFEILGNHFSNTRSRKLIHKIIPVTLP
jgi:hypothetical protein